MMVIWIVIELILGSMAMVWIMGWNRATLLLGYTALMGDLVRILGSGDCEQNLALLAAST
jgi:hypothetical protein